MTKHVVGPRNAYLLITRLNIRKANNGTNFLGYNITDFLVIGNTFCETFMNSYVKNILIYSVEHTVHI